MFKKSKVFLFLASFLLLALVVVSLGIRLGPKALSASLPQKEQGSEQKVAEADGGNEEAKAQIQAIQWWNLRLMDENGKIPGDGLIRAKAQIDDMKAAESANIDLAGLTRNSWVWLGPGNIGGRTRSIVVSPTDPNTMWAGSVSGGIWKTTNGGASWQIEDDFMTNLAVASMVIDPTDPNTLYAGTGEGLSCGGDPGEQISGDCGLQGAGIFKTTDGGTTWSQLSATNTPDFYYVNRLAISPADHLVLLAATQSGIWKTSDGGTTWNQVYGASGDSWYIADINFNPTDGTKAVAGGAYWGSAYYSTDSGNTWVQATFTSIGANPGRVEVAYAPSNPSIVYASININQGEIWKSTNGGQTYSQVNTGNSFLGTQGGYDNIVWVDPTNENNLIVGGIDLWRSMDGGATLTKISDWSLAPNSAHADHHAIVESSAFDGTTNRTVFFGNDGGIYKAADYTTVAQDSGWQELNNNYGVTQFYAGAGNPTSGVIVGGTQDNGDLQYTPANGTEGWHAWVGGDGGYSAADPTDPNYFYGEYVNANIHRSTDGATTSGEDIDGSYWNGSAKVYKAAPYRIDDAMNGTANFITPFILDPNDPNRLLVGGQSLWSTNDVKTPLTDTTGPAWYAIKSPTTGNSNISAIAVAPGNSAIIWVGHNNGDVYMTTNGTAASPAWTQMDLGTPNLPNRFVSRIAIDKNNNNKVYVTFGGFSSDNVYVTTDGGATWSDATGSGVTGLPDLPVYSLVINPNDSNTIYVGTELGIFESSNGGSTWVLPQSGPSNTAVDELFWMNNTLVAATHGRGMFKQDISTTVQIFTDVPSTYWAYSWINRLYNAGITGGCSTSPLMYCPDNTVTRAQMAVFLLKGIHGNSYSPPAATGTVFTDVPVDYWAAKWIEELSKEGITGGCATGKFCPDDVITRAQMAVFLLKSEHGSSYNPPAASGTVFTDVPVDYWSAKWIEQLAKEGITGGCGAGTYCPEQSVTRAQMAVFLVKTFNLP